MKAVFEWIALGTVILVLLLVVIGLFLPATYQVERSIIIEASAEEVFVQVSDFNKWSAWDPWLAMDTTAERTISGKLGNTGHKMTWEGEQVGIGSLVILSLRKNEVMATELVIEEPQAMRSTGLWTIEEVPEGVLVSWQVSGELDGIISKYFGLMLDGMLGKDFEKALQQLKEVCEKD